ncbi:MAG: hypothetical protein SFU83_14130 [Meiothermus sp.]|nr:hypothetical protein [Meiothermus sp.]
MNLRLPSTLERWLALLVISALTAGLAQGGAVPRPFVVTKPGAVAAAERLFVKLDQVGAVVRGCARANPGAAPAFCLCRHQAELRGLEAAYAQTLASHPSWRDKVVNWTQPQTKVSRALSMSGLARQLQAVAACPR